MRTETSGHGFERRKQTPASAQSADPVVDDPAAERDAVSDETVELSLETDAADADLMDADYLEVDDPDTEQAENAASAHRKRPAAPRRAEHLPLTGAIPTERIEAAGSRDVYDYDTDHRGIAPVPAVREDEPQPRDRDEQAHGDGTSRYEPRRKTRRRDRRRGRASWITATFIFVLLFGSAGFLDWYLWNTTQEWQEHATELTEANYELGAQLSAEKQTILQLNSEIDLLTQQLATSNQTVIALSADKAGAVDQSALRQQEIEALEGTLVSAGSVANSLHRCIDEQQQLAEYLRDAENYEPEDLESLSAGVDELCSSAERANDRLQEALNQ